MIVDVILLLILVSCTMSGWRKGLLMSLMSLLILVLCCMGATAARNTLGPQTAQWLEPQLEAMIFPSVETEVNNGVQGTLDSVNNMEFSIGGQTVSFSDLVALLRQFGLDLEERTAETASDALEPIAEATARAIAGTFAEKLSRSVIFGVVFLVLYLVLNNIALGINMVDRLPVVHTCNRIGGAVLSCGGCLLVMVVGVAMCAEAGLLPLERGPLLHWLLDLAGRL